jgi:hypothetical protein
MARFSFAMNAKLTTTTLTNAPGTGLLQQIYSSHANQDKFFYYILGNKQHEKRLYNYNKYGNRHLNVCN